jgi:methionyl-tRNA formyltransferase
MKYGIFTKPIHVEKIVNFLNQYTKVNYIISSDKDEITAYNYDFGVSYCWPFKIDESELKKRIWYNYHPGLLPKYHGMQSYADAIQDEVEKYGVTLHRMTEEVDNGPILCIRKFNLHTLPVHTNELGCITHYYLFQLFKETIETLKFMPVDSEDFDKRCAARKF